MYVIVIQLQNVLILNKSDKLTGTNIYINEDFSYETIMYKKQLWKEVKSLRSKDRLAYLNCRSIVVKDKISSTTSVG